MNDQRYKAKLRIDHTKVAGSDQVEDFPVLLTEANLPDPMLDSDAADGPAAQDGGGDLRFTSDAAGNNEIPAEVVEFQTAPDPSGASAQVWVKPDAVSGGTDTEIYAWWDTSGTSSRPDSGDANGRDAVWPGFQGVWHLESGAAGTGNADVYTDSSGNDFHGDDEVSSGEQDGKVGSGQGFDGNDDLVRTGMTWNGGKVTVLMWNKVAGADASREASGFGTLKDGAERFQAHTPWDGKVYWDYGTQSAQGRVEQDYSPYEDQWTRFAFTSHAGNSGADPIAQAIYANASRIVSSSTSENVLVDTNDFVLGGGLRTNSNLQDGYIDEVMVYPGVLSDDWIATDHANQADPAAFTSPGTAEPIDAPEVTSIARGATPGSNPTNASSVTFDVTFSEAVDGVDDGDFALHTTNSAGGNIQTFGPTTASNSITVTVDSITGDGDLRLDLDDDDSITAADDGTALSGHNDLSAGNGSFSGGESFTIDNTPPSLTDDTGDSTDEATDATIYTDLRANDSDTVSASGALAVTRVDGSGGNVGSATAGGNGGTFTITDDGQVDFNPDSDFESLAAGDSTTSAITVTVADAAGNTASQTVEATIKGVNDVPTAPDDSTPSTSETTSLTVSDGDPADLLELASDPDNGDNLSLDSINGTGFSDGSTVGLNDAASVTVNNDGSWTYSPNGAFNGLAQGDSATDGFTYTVADGNGGTDQGTISVTISGTNDAPTDVTLGSTALDLSAGTNAVVGSLNANDVDTGDTHTYALVSGPGDGDNGKFNIANGNLRANDTGNLAPGSYSVRVEAADGNGGTVAKSLAVTVNDDVAPTVTGASVDVNELTVTVTEPLATASSNVPDGDDFTVTAGSTTISVTNVNVSGKQLDLDLASAVGAGRSVSLDYTQDTNIPVDTDGNQLAAFSGQTVTNETDPPAPPPPPPLPPANGDDGDGDASEPTPPPPAEDPPEPPQNLDPDDDDLFTGQDQSSLDENPSVGNGLAATRDFTDTTIDGAPSTRGTTVDARGAPVTVTTIDPIADGQRIDENPLTEDVDFQVDDRVRTSVSDNIGLVVTERPGRKSNALAELLDGSGGIGGNGPGKGARAAFLETVSASGGTSGVDVVEVAPQMPMDSSGGGSGAADERRVRVDTGTQPTGGGDGRLTVVDMRNLADPTEGNGDSGDRTVAISGDGNVVVRGSGRFEGTDELADDGVPDPDNVLGDDSPQTLFFGPGDDTIRGLGGNDTVASAGGRDKLFGGEGNDRVRGGAGDDMLDGGAGDNALSGERGDDTLVGGTGDEALHGGPGDDMLNAGAGDDALVGGSGADHLNGGPGDDALAGGDGADRLVGGAGNDILIGGNGPDRFVLGTAGMDRLSDVDPETDTVVVPGASGFEDLDLAETASGATRVGLENGETAIARLVGITPVDLTANTFEIG